MQFLRPKKFRPVQFKDDEDPLKDPLTLGLVVFIVLLAGFLITSVSTTLLMRLLHH